MKKQTKFIVVSLVIIIVTALISSCFSNVSDTESPDDVSGNVIQENSEPEVSSGEISSEASDEVSEESSEDEESQPETSTNDEHKHTLSEWTTSQEATENAEGSKYRTCTKCDYKETAAIPRLSHTHSYDKWESEGLFHWQKCKCGAQSASSMHKYGNITTVKKATCTADGTKSHTCAVCGYEKSFTVPAAGHKYVSVITLSTDTEKGYTTHTCAYCGDKYVDSYTAPGFVYSAGLEYRVNEDGVSCDIIGIGTCTDEIVNIPSVIDGYRVVTIDSFAFERCAQLVSVTIPDTVTDIRYRCFDECDNMNYTVYDNALYLGNGDNPYYALISAANKGITKCEIHPDTVIIAGMAFSNCKNLTSISVTDKVETIGFSAFMDCTKLSTVTFGKGLKKIGGGAFESCEKITDIVIPDNVITIEDIAFAFCKSLASVTIGDGVTYIGTNAFFFCESLKTVILGNNVKYVGEEVFTGCNELQYNVFVDACYLGSPENPYLVLIKLASPSGAAVMPNGVKIIAGGAYDGCDFVNITVMEGITHIGPSAFRGCEYLKYLKLPDSLLYIGDRAFEGCLYLEDVTIPDSVTYIGSQAFSYCVNITEIVIPDGVVDLGLSAFSDCSGLRKATVGNGVTEIDGLMFDRCTNLTDISFGKNITRIGNGAFSECEKLNNVYYEGTESDFNKINIESANDPLSDATIHCK